MAALLAAGPLAAQRGHDVQAQALALVGSRTFVGAGVGAGARFGVGARLSVVASAGWLEDAGLAARSEALATYHLVTPGRPRAAPYGGAGVGVTMEQAGIQGHLVVVLGVESAPAGDGWFAEIGVGGGVRLSAGFRAVRLPRRRRR